jgi:hypothetical protein
MEKMRVLLLGLGVYLVISILVPNRAIFAWSDDPSVPITICNADGNQGTLRLIKIDDGYIVVWEDARRPGYKDIYAQKLDVDGSMKWANNGRVIAEGNNGETSNHLVYNSQSLTDIVSDTQGGAIALWTEDYTCGSGPCGNAWITRVHSNGDVQWGMSPSPGITIQGTDTAVLLNGHAHADAIAPDGEGGAFVIFGVNAWGSWYVFRLDTNGAYRSSTADVVGARSGARMIYGGNPNGKDYVNIAWWDYGDFAINVGDPEVNYPASIDTLYALWNKITLSLTPAWWSEPSLISDGAGGMIVVWEDDRNGNSDIFAQKISADGNVQWTPSGVPIVVQPGRQRRLQLVSDGSGGAVVVWEDSRVSATQTYTQHINADGDTQWTENGVLLSQRRGLSPQIIKSEDGNYLVVYRDNDANGGTPDYLRARKISPEGVPLGNPEGTMITDMGAPDDFQIASDGDGGAIVVWAWGDIYAQRVLSIPPDTSITDGPNGTITFNNPTFTYTGTDNVTPTDHLVYATYLEGYDSDWSSFSPSATKSYSNLPLGSYTFQVKAKDLAGNEDPTPATWSFTVTLGPATLVSPSGLTYSATPTYTWNAASNSTGYRLRVNDSTGNKINQFYTASEVGCASGTGNCSVTPTTVLAQGSWVWRVQTWNPAAEGLWSADMSFTVSPPEAATLVFPSGDITDTTPTYTWNAVPYSSWYHLWVNDSTGNKINQWYTRGEAGCASGTGNCTVTPPTEVRGAGQWWVQTYSSVGLGPWSAGLSFTAPTPLAPSAAIQISPTGVISDATPTYTWNAVSNATWYCLYVNDSTGNKINQWYTSAQANCPLGTGNCTATPTTEVRGAGQWWVRTYNSAGLGPWSSGMSFTAPIPTAPSTATQISPTGAISDTTPTYTWNAVSNTTWYCLYVNDSTGNKINQWYPAADAGCGNGVGTCTVTPTTEVRGAGQWWVRTYNSGGLGSWSLTMSFAAPTPAAPSAATQVSPTGTINDTTPAYRWNPVASATWYQLWVGDSSGTKISQWYAAAEAGCADGVGTCSVTPSTMVLGPCNWYIRTYNSGGLGPWSSGMSFTVSP